MNQVVEATRSVFRKGKTRPIAWRKKQLLALIDMLIKEKDSLCDVVFKDLHKHSSEAQITEIDMCKNDAINAYNNLEKWTAPEKAKKNLLLAADGVYIMHEPYGVALVIGAWNYPLQLVILPLIGAIAAGNCCIIKPSEVSEATAQFLAEIIPKYLDNEAIKVINGGVPETTALLAEKFDLIFYTGNSVVARIVAEAAAKHLTPTVLELGGKSPCYIDSTSDLDLVSRRLIWGRFMNCGQTCIAPDYVMCTKPVEENLVARLRENLKQFYGDDAKKSDSYGRVVNSRHFERVKGYMEGANIAIGGKTDASQNYIEPTVLVDCQPRDAAMQNEIFGPVLPIMTVNSADEAIDFINSREKPLAMYLFSKDKSVTDKFIDSTSCGGVTVNDTIMHASVESLPFGGVGNSGQGSYHGKFSFDAFSHKKAVLDRKQAMEKVNDLRYPPYTDRKLSIAQWAMGKKLKSEGIFSSVYGFFKLVIVGVVLGTIGKMLGVDKYLPKLN